MTSLREVMRRWLGRTPVQAGSDAFFSYRLFWTREARHWHADRRRAVRAEVSQLTRSAGFVANELGRRYALDGLDRIAHSGASLVALLQVLDALEATGGGNDG